ncbi:MAG: TRCF domain-containing protein [bacterium]
MQGISLERSNLEISRYFLLRKKYKVLATPEQKGNSYIIKEVGLGLYSQLLKETVDNLRGVKREAKQQASLDIPYDAFIPSLYIPEQGDRFFFYKRLAEDDSEKVASEMRDRFGLLPMPVQRLIEAYKRRIR